MDRIWECWVADWLNAVEREHGMGDRAIDMLDGLEIDLPLQQAAAPEERRFFELLRQSQESLLNCFVRVRSPCWRGIFRRRWPTV